MAAQKQDNWSSEAYQNSASFVPKLATKVMQWLDPQKDDVILDLGCGGTLSSPRYSTQQSTYHHPDGVLDLQIGQVLSQGSGTLHGIDGSPAMIEASKKATAETGLQGKCTFEVLDATELLSHPSLPNGTFTKVFSNAAMHWILRPPARRETFFRGVRDALAPGGRFVFEMGGLGNVCEVRAALLSAIGRRIGLAKTLEVEPWFFPDEKWAREMVEVTVGGMEVERVEREWRPTDADTGGIEGWVRLMAKQFFEALPEGEREGCIREVVDVLEVVCAKPGGGYMFSYVRLRAVVRKV
ncbi:S-adenosyl-L-methionine-dependent methyltransferase [Cercophora newfieldiana]|uniref:S-adenosyl-L-methionine-dependent methyltransferase n=1 Tax=Cercophora newfieldiana TaxID=92897 RepID=A0AA39YRD8_9PEZI|nr:S-adenosyl-L-methionine-dependent methyltransferase [Cercophora newfieldiana]